jgi:hypothetical protein
LTRSFLRFPEEANMMLFETMEPQHLTFLYELYKRTSFTSAVKETRAVVSPMRSWSTLWGSANASRKAFNATSNRKDWLN